MFAGSLTLEKVRFPPQEMPGSPYPSVQTVSKQPSQSGHGFPWGWGGKKKASGKPGSFLQAAQIPAADAAGGRRGRARRQVVADFIVPVSKLLEVAGSGQCLEVELTKEGVPAGNGAVPHPCPFSPQLSLFVVFRSNLSSVKYTNSHVFGRIPVHWGF